MAADKLGGGRMGLIGTTMKTSMLKPCRLIIMTGVTDNGASFAHLRPDRLLELIENHSRDAQTLSRTVAASALSFMHESIKVVSFR